MPEYTIYHNPGCSKSCNALQVLRERGIEPRVVDYLSETPDIPELEMLVMKLGIPARDLVRKNEPLFERRYRGLDLNEHEWIRVLHENPVLIERPVVVRDHKAVIGRPMEIIMELIDRK